MPHQMSATLHGGLEDTGAAGESSGLADGHPRLHHISVGRANSATLQYCLLAAMMTIVALLIFAPIGASVSTIFARIHSAFGGT